MFLPVFHPEDELVKSVNMFKASLVCNRKNYKKAVPGPHVLLPHRTELLLSCGVQY